MRVQVPERLPHRGAGHPPGQVPLPHDMPFLQMFAETLTTTLCASVAIQSDCPSDVAAVVEQLQHNKKCGPGRHDERRVDDVAARAAGPRGHLLAGVGVDDAQRPHLFRCRAIGRPRQRERCRRQQPDGPISGRPNAQVQSTCL